MRPVWVKHTQEFIQFMFSRFYSVYPLGLPLRTPAALDPEKERGKDSAKASGARARGRARAEAKAKGRAKAVGSRQLPSD